MIDQTEVIAKYNEYYISYGNKNIDDYDTFIRSRVIEHFIRLYPNTIDELTEIVNTTINNMGNTRPVDSHKESWPSTSEEQKGLPVFPDDSTTNMEENGKKLSPILIMITVAGLLTYLFRHRKR